MKVAKPNAGEIQRYKCMFFDFDGVVLESGDIKTKAFIELYAGRGIEEEVKAHHLANQGISRFDKFKWIAENLLNESYTEEKGRELGERFSLLVRNKVIQAPFVRGFMELIKSLMEHDVYCVIASGTPQTELDIIVSERQLNRCFKEVHGSPKKKEGIIEDVVNRLGFLKEECLFFGDASTDYEAAEAAGVDFYARLTEELSDYWKSVVYRFGTGDFEGLVY